MKTEAAERMRQKLEKRLLPKLKVSVPQMAEKLRFLHMGIQHLHTHVCFD